MFTVLWILWGVAFAVIEGVAIYRDSRSTSKGFTLSEHLRRWFRTDTHVGRSAWAVISGLFFGWFVIHIALAGAIF